MAIRGERMMGYGMRSQIATIIVFMIAVIFLFVLISINIGRLAQKKTAVSNVADSAGLQLASQLGSMANALRQDNRIYGYAPETCDWNAEVLIGAGAIVLGSFLLPWSGGLSASLIIGGAIMLGTSVAQHYIVANAGAQELLNMKFKTLTTYQTMVESPVNSVLLALGGEDPAFVPDAYDMDRDGQIGSYDANGKITGDAIPRFLKWYNLRLNSFPRLRESTEKFYNDLFDNKILPDGTINSRFAIKEDENLMVKKGKGSIRWQVDSNSDGIRDLTLVSWFREQLPAMLGVMENYGYGINVGIQEHASPENPHPIVGNIDDKGRTPYQDLGPTLVYEIESVEGLVRGLYNIDFDSAVQSLDKWLPYLKVSNDTGIALYGRLERLKISMIQLRDKLQERKGQIHQCIESCSSATYQCCNNCCVLWQPEEKKSSLLAYHQDGLRSVYDSGGGILSAIETPEGVGTPEPPPCEPEWGCCGAQQGCGINCGTPCEPQQICKPPLGPAQKCCLFLPLEPNCSDNIVDRYNAIMVLDSFIADIVQMRFAIDKLAQANQAVDEKSYGLMHEAFYVWQDKVGRDTPAAQALGHIAYVKIEKLDPRPKNAGGDDFKLPYTYSYSDWRWNIFKLEFGSYLCKKVVLPKQPEFILTVARFDEPISSDKGKLSKFWKFRYGGKISKEDADFVRDMAEMFKDSIAKDKYDSFGELNPEKKERLISIMRSYGIASKVKVHYGPGYTFSPDEIKNNQDKTPAGAVKRNKDIYIMKTCSRLDCDMN